MRRSREEGGRDQPRGRERSRYGPARFGRGQTEAAVSRRAHRPPSPISRLCDRIRGSRWSDSPSRHPFRDRRPIEPQLFAEFRAWNCSRAGKLSHRRVAQLQSCRDLLSGKNVAIVACVRHSLSPHLNWVELLSYKSSILASSRRTYAYRTKTPSELGLEISQNGTGENVARLGRQLAWRTHRTASWRLAEYNLPERLFS